MINRAYCYSKLEFCEEAIEDYIKILMKEENNIHVLNNLGLCYEKN